MSLDFNAILDTPLNSENFKKPDPTPEGSYLFQIEKGMPKQEKTRNGNDVLIYQARIVQPMEDVDEEAVSKIPNLSSRTMRVDLYLTENSLWRLKEFAEICGIEDNVSLRQALDMLPGSQFIGKVVHDPIKDKPGEVYPNIKQFARAE